MKFTVMQSDLQRALHLVASVVPSKSTLPILEAALMDVSPGGEMTLTTTDLDISVRTRRTVDVEEGGRVAVSARRLNEVVRELPDQELSISGEESGLTLKCGSGRYRFVGAPIDDFPPLPEIPEEKQTAVEAKKLDRMVRRTLYAVSLDETRPELTGVLLEILEHEVRMVATNGHRLARASVRGPFKPRGTLLLPPKALHQLLRLLPETGDAVEIAGTKSYARFRLGETQLYSRLLEGPFPQYEAVIPKENPLRATIAREDLFASLRRILVLSDAQTRQVRMVVEPSRLQILAEYQGAGEALEELPLAYEGEPLTIGYNGSYLLDMLKTFEADRLEMAFHSSTSAGVFQPTPANPEEELLCLVMPLRLPDAG